MKKIYSKITKERQKKFQIETSILKDGENQWVTKKALLPEGNAHIQNMSRYYEAHRETDHLCQSELLSECEIAFSFVRGESLCNELLMALDARDELKYVSLLKTYDDIIRENVQIERGKFEPDAEFKETFGEAVFPEEMEYAKGLNIDMTFDNIIRDENDGHYKTIDYEWIFPFDIPLKFVIYRAVLAFYTRNASAMKDIVTLREMYDCFRITEEETDIFAGMNEAFIAYVYGGADGYNENLIPYKKEVYDVKKLLPEQNLFLQVFLNDGTAYLENKAVTRMIDRKQVHLDIPLEVSDEIREIRLDPLNVSCVLSSVNVEAVRSDGSVETVKEYRHNAMITPEGDYIFTSEDPQIIFENKWEDDLERIHVSFEVKEAGLLENPMTAQLENLKKELDYIKSSKVYKALLEKKVEKVLGDNL